MKLIALILLAACGGTSKPIVAANPNAADCIAERVSQQAKCIQRFKTDPEINACRDGVKAAITCTTDAGVEAYEVTASKDGGK